MGGNQLPVCAAGNGRRVKMSPCSTSFYHHDCTAQFMKLLIVLFSQHHQYHAFCYLATYCQQSVIKRLQSVFFLFSLIIFFLLFCYMKYLNRKLDYLAPGLFVVVVVVVVVITTMTFPTCCSLSLNIVLKSMHSPPQTELPKAHTSWLEHGFYRLPC